MRFVTISILFSSCMLLLSSCRIAGTEDEGLLEVHLQGSFNSTPVQVLFDSRVVFDSLATTNWIGGLAERIPVRATQGPHMLQVVIDDEHLHRAQIILDAEVYVAVRYNALLDEPITFEVSQIGFGYF